MTTQDIQRLNPDKHLNDVIIDFYLRYICLIENMQYVLYRNRYLWLELCTDIEADKIHIFSSYFYSKLSSNIKRATKSVVSQNVLLTYPQLKGWTKDINIFEKDLIIVPINEQY